MCILDFVELSEYCHDQEFGIRHTYIQTPALSPMNCGDRGKFYLNSQNLDFFNCQMGLIIVPTS